MSIVFNNGGLQAKTLNYTTKKAVMQLSQKNLQISTYQSGYEILKFHAHVSIFRALC